MAWGQGKSLRNTALDLLSRREHSRGELQRKLADKGFEADQVELELERLVTERLQDDARFAENYIRYRRQKGFGPIKIRHELRERAVADVLIADLLDSDNDGWQEQLQNERHKKFGQSWPQTPQQKLKQQRFLVNRGFSHESVMRLFRQQSD